LLLHATPIKTPYNTNYRILLLLCNKDSDNY
jgi:hypothetical protein